MLSHNLIFYFLCLDVLFNNFSEKTPYSHQNQNKNENTNKDTKDLENEGVEEMAKQKYRYTKQGVKVWVSSYTKRDGTRVKGHWRLIDTNYLRYISPSGATVIGYKKSRRRWY